MKGKGLSMRLLYEMAYEFVIREMKVESGNFSEPDGKKRATQSMLVIARFLDYVWRNKDERG